MKKMFRFILLIIVVLGIAAGVGMWKVRQLADSKILIKEETLAQSLIRQPDLLLLDEPLSALDLNYQFHKGQHPGGNRNARVSVKAHPDDGAKRRAV
jgi:hypothetical protein